MKFESIDPATGKTVQTYEAFSAAELDTVLGQVQQAQSGWRKQSFTERATLTRRVASLLKARSREIAELMAREMGKPLEQGVSEAEKCAWVCEYYAEHAQAFLASQDVESDASRSLVAFEPLGIVLAVMPWNFPFWQVFRFAAPNLMAGNAGVLKHASNVSGCALAIEDLFRESGFPDDLFRSPLMPSSAVSGLIENEKIRAVTLTGSTPAGRAVASKAGEMLKKTVLELGGSDPYIVLADADIEHAAETCVESRLINSGQSCIAAKRFIVVSQVAGDFETRVVQKMAEKRIGNPFDDGVHIGPLAKADLREELHEQVQQSIDAGALCKLGGNLPSGPGAFYPATVVSGIDRGMPAYDDELFGPVASIIEAKDEDHAIELANDTSFGLGAAIFTQDVERGERIATERLQAGCCFVNDFVKSDPRLPFGGIKESGYGRELGQFGIREFVNTKTVYVK